MGGEPGCSVSVTERPLCTRDINCWVRFCFSAALNCCDKATVIEPRVVAKVKLLAFDTTTGVAVVCIVRVRFSSAEGTWVTET